MNDINEQEQLASGFTTPDDLCWNSDIEEGVKSAADEMDIPLSFDDKQNDGMEDSESRKRRTPPMFGAGGMVPVTRRKKKPRGIPKRPLTAYNVFFQQECPKIIAEEEEKAKDDPFPQKKIKFEDLGRIIAKRWKDVSEKDRQRYETLAEEDTFRFRKEMEAYNEDKRKKEEEEKERTKKKCMDKPASQEGKPSLISPPASLASLPISTSQGLAPLLYPLNLSTPVKARIPGMYANHASPTPTPSPPSDTPQFLISPDLVNSNVRTFPPLPAHQQQTARDAHPQAWQQHGSNQFGRHSSSMAEIVPSATSGSIQARPATTTHQVQQQLCNSLPVPPGMMLTLPDSSGRDRKYTVNYSFYSMSRKDAQEFMRSLEVAAAETGTEGPATSPAAATNNHCGSLFVPLPQSAHPQPQSVLGQVKQVATHPRYVCPKESN